MNKLKTHLLFPVGCRHLICSPLLWRPAHRLWLIFLLAGGAGGGEALAQRADDVCMKELKSIYKKYNNLTMAGMPEDKVYYMNYTVYTATQDSASTGILKSDVVTWMDKENLEVRSREMEVYQNSKEAFIVLPAKKLVMHNDAVVMDNKKINNKVKRMQFVQDTLFSMSRIRYCNTVSSGTATVKRVELQVNDKGIAMTNISRLILDINETTKEFTRIKVLYSSRSKGLLGDVVWLEYVFNDVSFDYKGKEWAGNLSKTFLRSSHKLQEKYKGYELVDNRKKIIKTPQ